MKNRNRALGATIAIAATAIGGCGGHHPGPGSHRVSETSPVAATTVSPVVRCQADVMRLLAGVVAAVKQGYDPISAGAAALQVAQNQ